MTLPELEAEYATVLSDIDRLAKMPAEERKAMGEVPAEAAPMMAPEGEAAAMAEAPEETLAGDMAPSPEEALSAISPDSIMAVSQDLVDMGYLEVPTDRVTPDFKAALRMLVDERMPGMFDLDDPVQLVEAIRATERGDLAGTGSGSNPSPGSPGPGPDLGGDLVGGDAAGASPPAGPSRIGTGRQPSPLLGL